MPLIRSPFLIFLFFIVLTCIGGWVSDDAMITLRAVDNFLNGYGMRWNVDERVQVFTHPLWFFFLTAGPSITNEYFLTTVAMSVFVSIWAVFLIYSRVSIDNTVRWWGMILVCASMSCIDYTSSGLENPLSHLLVVFFFLRLIKVSESFTSKLTLCLSISLLATTRMDLSLLCIPGLLTCIVTKRHGNWFFALILGALPFFAWELFSVFYYGSFFPNTAYAKLAAQLERSTVLEQGYLYFLDSLLRDPITLLVIVSVGALAFIKTSKLGRGIATGLFLYLFYVFWIGGDFMSGRFFSTPFVLALCLLTHYHGVFTTLQSRLPILVLFSLGARFATHIAVPTIDENNMCTIPSYTGVADEAGCYSPSTGVARLLWGMPYPSPLVRESGEKYLSSGYKVISAGNVGMLGFWGGPSAKIIDVFGLTDPLLARLPASPGWLRVGHLCRGLPEGYLLSVLTDSNKIVHPELAQYYTAIRAITRDSLLDPDRLATIISYQLGKYDHFLESFPRMTVHRAYWCQGYGMVSEDTLPSAYPPK